MPAASRLFQGAAAPESPYHRSALSMETRLPESAVGTRETLLLLSSATDLCRRRECFRRSTRSPHLSQRGPVPFTHRRRVSWRWVDFHVTERFVIPHADFRRHRYRFQLLQAEDRPRAGAPAQNARRRSRSHASRRQRLRHGTHLTGGYGRHAARAQAISARRAGARRRPYSRGGHRGHARRAQCRRFSGMGQGGDRLEHGDHLRPGRRPPHSPWRHRRRAGRRRPRAAARPWRRKLRAHAL